MFFERHEKRKSRETSSTREKMGGYRICCHIIAEDKMALRPNIRNNSVGLERRSKT